MTSKKSSSTQTIVDLLNQKISERPEVLEGFAAIYQFAIGEETWFLDALKPTKATQIKNGKSKSPDCEISVSQEDFEKLCNKELALPWALLRGKIKISGQKSLALKLAKLFS